jgi:hypothetical protein
LKKESSLFRWVHEWTKLLWETFSR